MGAGTEEMGSETLRPLPDLRARALVSESKPLLIERNGATFRVPRPRVPQIYLTADPVVRDRMTEMGGLQKANRSSLRLRTARNDKAEKMKGYQPGQPTRRCVAR